MRHQGRNYTASVSLALTPGSALGPFDILELLNGHGAADIYQASDSRTDQIVTIKFLGERMSYDDASRARLLRDAETLGRFSHPFVAPLLEIGEDEEQGGVYAVYQHVPGTSLLELLEQRRLSAARAVTLAVQLGETVADMHGAGLVHGDLGPGAIMIAPDGRGHVLFLGAGRAALGPRSYLAPELGLDERGDVFSLGALLAQMLIGKSAPMGTAPSAIVKRIDPSLPDDLRRIVLSALAASPAERCASAAAFAAELSGVAAVMDLRKR